VDGTNRGRTFEKYFFGRRVESDWKVGSAFKMWQRNGTLDAGGFKAWKAAGLPTTK
jgi:rhodanese-related sulfurtransferase